MRLMKKIELGKNFWWEDELLAYFSHPICLCDMVYVKRSANVYAPLEYAWENINILATLVAHTGND